MKDSAHGRPFELDFDLDEVRSCGEDDRSEKPEIVAFSLKDKLISHTIDHPFRNITALICVAAGDILPHCVGIASNPNINSWKEAGLNQQKRIVIAANSQPYVNASLFENLVVRLFLPNLPNSPRSPVLSGQKGVSLMDRCKPHVLDPVQIVLGPNGLIRSLCYSHHKHLSNAGPVPLWPL
jgi:hypothetical protein